MRKIKQHLKSTLNHAGFRRYLVNTSWMFAEQILRMIAGLFVGIWVARYLGPEQFGVFSYATTFVAIFASIAKLGLDGIVVRDLINCPDKINVYLGTAFWLKFAGALTSIGIIAAATLFIPNNRITNIYIFIIASGIVFQSFEVIDFYFQSKVLSKFVSLCKMAQLIISSLLKVYFVLTESDLFWFVLVSLVDQISLAVTLYAAYNYQKLGGFYHHFDWAVAKNLLKDSWPLVFSSLVIVIYMRVDQIMIKEMLNEKEVGLFSAAARLTEAWYFVPMAITNSLFPAIASAKKISEEFYYARLQRLYTFLVWTAIGIALPITFSSDWLVTLLYGEDYREAGKVLIIHIWTVVFVFLLVGIAQFLIVEGKTIFAFFRNALGMLTNVALNLLLIPKYGIQGAAIASLLAYVFSSTISNLLRKDMWTTFEMEINTLIVPIHYLRRLYGK